MITEISQKIQKVLFPNDANEHSLYTPQDKVVEELYRRRALIKDDAKLLEAIKPTPAIQRLIDEPHLVFARQIATPLHETLRVIEIAKATGLKLCILEYRSDRMVVEDNIYKHGLCKMPIFNGIDRNKDDIIFKRSVVDLNTYAGQPLLDVKTYHDESLVNFHHELLTKVTGIEIDGTVVDASNWLAQFNNNPSEYYKAFFTLFVKYSVLAEIYSEGVFDKDDFTKEIIVPNFKHVTNSFVFSPLIINFQPHNEQNRPYWDSYPLITDDLLSEKGYN